MLWEQRRESLCQRQRWHSGSRLHILWFSYLISKNTFFSPPASRSNSEAERKHGYFVVSFYMNGHSHWNEPLPLCSRVFLC